MGRITHIEHPLDKVPNNFSKYTSMMYMIIVSSLPQSTIKLEHYVLPLNRRFQLGSYSHGKQFQMGCGKTLRQHVVITHSRT